MRNLFLLLVVSIGSMISCGLSADGGPPQDIGLENTIFPSTKLIKLNSPENGETIATTLPHFSWKASGKTLVFAGLFKKSIDMKGRNISNTEDMIGAWHSGLSAGRIGDVELDEGVIVVNGELDINNPPSPLINGETYFWAVWAWDEEGSEVTHSSEEFFFTVSF